MKVAKIFFTFLFILPFFIAVALGGCSEPVGSLLYSVDYIMAEPNRILYGENDEFMPAKDLKVIGVFGGVEDVIDINKVGIKIIHLEGFTGEKEEPVDNKDGYLLDSTGRKKIVITYNNLETRYYIAVGEPGIDEGGWGVNPDGSSGSSGIIIIWN